MNGLDSIENWSIEEFLQDVFSFFKYSAARREDYFRVQELLNLEGGLFKRYVESRWTTLSDVLGVYIGQFESLKEYFNQLKDTSATNSARYKRIRSVLASPWSEIYMNFLKSVGTLLNDFLILFQARKPLIHALYSSMSELLLKLLQRFVKSEVIDACGGDYETVCYGEKENQRHYSAVEIGEIGNCTQVIEFKIS